MASKNSVLLIIKQSPGLKYHDLLAKISGEYSNINSARAALSRLVRDLEALGFVRRKNNQLFLTDKGVLKIQIEMKNKLLLRLNELVKEADYENPGPIVQQLSVLVERSKQDADLLRVAKSSVSFPISRLETINSNIIKQSRHLSYLSKIISRHVKALREMNFNDSTELNLSEKKKQKIISVVSGMLGGEFMVKCNDSHKKQGLEKTFNGKIQGESILFPADKFEKIVGFLLDGKTEKTSIIAAGVKTEVNNEKLVISGPAKKILEISK